MALTRSLLRGLGIEDDKIGAIIEAHTETVNSLKEQRDTYKADAEKYADVQKELDDLKKLNAGDWQKKYEKEHSDFEAYKTAQSDKESKEAKAEAYKELLKEAGVSEKLHKLILGSVDLKGMELKDGKFEKAEELKAAIKKDYADLISIESKKGADTKTPPAGGGGKMTKEEILKITDAGKRQEAIQENHELFGF